MALNRHECPVAEVTSVYSGTGALEFESLSVKVDDLRGGGAS